MQHLSPKKFKDEYSFYTFLKIVFAKFDHTPNKSFARFRQVPSNLRQVFLPGFVLFWQFSNNLLPLMRNPFWDDSH